MVCVVKEVQKLSQPLHYLSFHRESRVELEFYKSWADEGAEVGIGKGTATLVKKI